MEPKGWYVYYAEPRRFRGSGLLYLQHSERGPVRDENGRWVEFADAEAIAAELARIEGEAWADKDCYFVDMWNEFVGEKYDKIDWNEVLKEAM